MKFIKILSILFFLLYAFFIINTAEYYNDGFGYYVNIPEGWKILDSSNPATISFTDPQENAVLQIFVFTGGSFNNAEGIYNHIKTQLYAIGDGSSFNYAGNDTYIADLTFSTSQITARGYFVFINRSDYDYALLSFCSEANYEIYHDFLLSALDSFSINNNERLTPGPVSQFYYPFPAKNKKQTNISVNNKNIKTSFDESELEASQVVIDREARILATYAKDETNKIKAWQRFFKMIYKDNYKRLESITELLKKEFKLNNLKDEEIVKTLLPWIQKYEYKREGKEADFTSPLQTMFLSTGDCDSRAVLFVIILNQLNIDSIIFVSEEYHHSAAGINLNINGAKMNFKGKDYLYTELTAVVDAGMIPQKMADPSKWIAVDFIK